MDVRCTLLHTVARTSDTDSTDVSDVFFFQAAKSVEVFSGRTALTCDSLQRDEESRECTHIQHPRHIHH